MKYANIYFLITAILNCFPIISTVTPISAIAPLVFVIMLSMLREAIEDYQRHKSDNELNSSSCIIYEDNKFISKTWKEVQIGQILKISAEEMIPADMIVLVSS